MAQFSTASQNLVGVGIESTPGIPQIPQKWIPASSESLSSEAGTQFLRYLKGTPDPTGAIAGNQTHEGSIEVDALHDCLPWLLAGARTTVQKSETSGSHNYLFSPSGVAAKSDFGTLTFWIRRGGTEWFVFSGCVVSRWNFSVNDSLLGGSFDVISSAQFNLAGALLAMGGVTLVVGSGAGNLPANNGVPVTNTVGGVFVDSYPWGAGQYAISIGAPNAEAQKYDVENFTFECDDSGESQHRLQNVRRGPWFVKFGERSVKATCTRDFTSRLEFDQYLDATRQGFKAVVGGGPGSSVRNEVLELILNSSIIDNYSIEGGSGQGDLITQSVDYMGIAPGESIYEANVKLSSEEIVSDNNILGMNGNSYDTAPAMSTTRVLTNMAKDPGDPDPVGHLLRWRPKGSQRWKQEYIAGAAPNAATLTGVTGAVEYQFSPTVVWVAKTSQTQGAWTAVKEVSLT